MDRELDDLRRYARIAASGTGLDQAGPLQLSLVVAFAAAVIALKIYSTLTRGSCASKVRMHGKTVIVTGANSGIGKETARELALRGARVIMACRNLESAERAKENIVRSTGNVNVFVKKLDLSSLESVRAFAEDVNNTEPRLDVLIHNAGVAYTFGKMQTPDGLDITLGTNHFGPFLLTHLLIELLRKSQPARIVIVASDLYRLAVGFNIERINPVGFWCPAYLYYYSKYVNIVFALELSRRLEGSGVTVNCLHPGMIDSGIWRNVPCPLNLLLYPVIKGLFKTPEDGCQTSVYCALAQELEGVTGKYYVDCKEKALGPAVQDPALGKKLWELSEPLVKLRATDPRI